LTWTKINHNLQSLKTSGVIRIEQRFQDGGLQSVVSAEPSILTQYQSLKDVLLEFFNATENLDKFLEVADSIDANSKDQLYPTD